MKNNTLAMPKRRIIAHWEPGDIFRFRPEGTFGVVTRVYSAWSYMMQQPAPWIEITFFSGAVHQLTSDRYLTKMDGT